MAAFVACWGLLRAPAWASGAMGGSAPAVLLEGSLAERAARYTGVCGSLASDLMVAVLSFFVLACCAGTETAITTLWPWKVREFAQQEREQGRRGKWTAVRQDIQRFMQTILIGTTLSGVISASFITEMCGQLFGPKGLGIAAVSVSFIQLTVGEIVPKLLAVSNPVVFCAATLPTFYRISAIVYPFSKFLNKAISILLGSFGLSVDTNKTPLVSEAELDLMFNSAMKSGVVDAEEGDMIRSVRNLDRKSVKEVMTPLVDMICIDSQAPISRLHELWRETQFSRVPVYSIRVDSVTSVVSMKSLLKHAPLFDSSDKEFDDILVEEIADRAMFVPETMSLLNALKVLKERTIVICVDEYGGTTGLITLEDVLEEIVGEIYDPDEEKDNLERKQNISKIKQISENSWSMSAVAELDDVNEVLGIEIPSGDYNSIGGFVCMHIDRIPETGEAVLVEAANRNIRFEVVEVDERRVLQIEATVLLDSEVETIRSWVEDDEEERAAVLGVRMETDEEEMDEEKTVGPERENVVIDAVEKPLPQKAAEERTAGQPATSEGAAALSGGGAKESGAARAKESAAVLSAALKQAPAEAAAGRQAAPEAAAAAAPGVGSKQSSADPAKEGAAAQKAEESAAAQEKGK